MLSQIQDSIRPYLGYFSDNLWIQALVIILASFIIAWIFDRFIITTLKRLATKTKVDIDDQLIDLLHTPIYSSIILLGLSFAIYILSLGNLVEFIAFSFFKTIALIIWSILLLKATRILLRHIAKNDEHINILHIKTLPLFENIANITIFIFAIYIIFSTWNIDMTAWLASAGIVGIAVGFAAKDTLANLFSGVFIMADAPYKIGDFVVLDSGERGEITHIGIRSTRLLTRDDVEVIIPNSVMSNTKIINESGGPNEKYRIRIAVGVAYGSNIDLVRSILTDIAIANDSICSEPEPRVRFRTFGASSLDFELLGWIDQPVLKGRVIDLINCQIYKRFIEEKIEIPYSKQDLYIKELPKSSG
ncbi:MAG: MscS family membrane protein [Candidatus Azotimanducaceae bacterium]|jgi:MscS family membrane protein